MSEINPMGMGFPPIGNFDLAQLLQPGAGPVNWDVAKFVALAMAGDADARPRWSEIEAEYGDLVRAAEVQVAQYTSLSADHLLTPVEVVSRARWAENNLEAFAPLMEPLARKVAQAQSHQAGAMTGGVPIANLLEALGPMMMGAQTGMLVGFLAHNVLGRYDVAVPPSSGGALTFVAPNLEEAERSLNVVPRDFKFWLALREVVHAIEYSQPGVRAGFVKAAVDVVDIMEVDFDRLSEIGDLDPSDPTAMMSMMDDPSGLLGALSTPAEHEALDRMTAYTELIEGYAEHVVEAVGGQGIADLHEIEQSIEERSEGRGEVEDVFEQTLGFKIRSDRSHIGRQFCDNIAAVEGIPALNRVWRDDASRPTLAELQNPEQWLARTIGLRG